MAKATTWTDIDAETRTMNTRRRGYDPCSAVANVLSIPPGEYGRKIKTQRN